MMSVSFYTVMIKVRSPFQDFPSDHRQADGESVSQCVTRVDMFPSLQGTFPGDLT